MFILPTHPSETPNTNTRPKPAITPKHIETGTWLKGDSGITITHTVTQPANQQGSQNLNHTAKHILPTKHLKSVITHCRLKSPTTDRIIGTQNTQSQTHTAKHTVNTESHTNTYQKANTGSGNIFRCLPPASHENTGQETTDPE
jgi:membrane-bound lytic murein transglycosylase